MIKFFDEALAEKMEWNTCVNSVFFANCLHHKKQKAVIVRTLSQLLHAMSYSVIQQLKSRWWKEQHIPRLLLFTYIVL